MSNQPQQIVLRNETDEDFSFLVTTGPQNAGNTVNAHSSWTIPFDVSPGTWVTVKVVSLNFCYQALNASVLYFVSEGGVYALNCKAGEGGGGCDTRACP